MNSRATSFAWGLLGHQRIGSERRTRTLGLGAAVREFNDGAIHRGSVVFGSAKNCFWPCWASESLKSFVAGSGESEYRDGQRR